MNFSEAETNKKLHKLKIRRKRYSTKVNVHIFRLFLISLIFLTVSGVSVALGAINGLAATCPPADQMSVVPDAYISNIYYRDGSLAEILRGAEANREYVSISELPPYVKYTFVAMEDERFYEHKGIDARGIMRAIVSDLKSRSLKYGASTITQQLLKNQILGGGNENNPVDKLSRKIQEQFLAINLENIYEKDTILEYYINIINYGSTAYGLKTAAKIYFNKNPEDLTLSETAVLAAIPNSPVLYNPVNYPKANATRRKDCLQLMVDNKFITQEEMDEAMADDPYSRIQAVAQEKTTSSDYSYFTDSVIDAVIKDLMEQKGYTYAQATNLVFKGGLSIYTTQDHEMQKICDEVYTDESMFPAFGLGSEEGSLYEVSYALSVQKADETAVHYQINDLIKYFDNFKKDKQIVVEINDGVYELLCTNMQLMNTYIDEFRAAHLNEEAGEVLLGEKKTFSIQPQSSFCIMDQYTGEVLALVGGRGEKKGNRILNRAVSSKRQVGSTFKVLASFLPAIDSAGMTLATPIDDIPFYYPGTKKEVINWWAKGKQKHFNGPFYGLNTIRRGISYSMNVLAVRTLEQVSPQIAFNYLKKLGFTSLVEKEYREGLGEVSDIGLPLALGGLTDGVTNLEMTAAYASIANGGVYNKPHLYTKVLDHDGRVLLSYEPKSSTVMKSSTAYLLTSAMIDTVTGGTGNSTGSLLRFKHYEMPVAGKTGTADSGKDLWFCGYTPYLTATVWSGFDHNYIQIDQNYQQKIWQVIMERIHEAKGYPKKDFDIPSSIVTAKICTKSGKLAIDGICDCAEGGSTVRTEYFAKGTVPYAKCDVHIKATVCKDSGKLACPHCPADSVEDKVLLNKIEPEILDWDGKVIEYQTSDTPYLLPTGEDSICPLHNPYSPVHDPNSPLYDPDAPFIDTSITDPYSPDYNPGITPEYNVNNELF